tara:strand:- start:898 stop:1317 length:420 start_codon:yes stop_codon:yes gene_type:complete
MNKLFLTITLALFTTMASAQYSVLTTVTEVEEEYNVTDKIGVGYNLNDCTMVGVTMDGEDKYEFVARYVFHKCGAWVTGVYNYEADDESELVDKMELGIGYSLKVWDKLYIDPNYTMPAKADADGNREGTLNLSVSYKF